MISRNHLTLSQVRNRPRQLQHAVKRPCRPVQLLHRRLQQLLSRRVRLATLPHLRRVHLCITGQLRPLEALELSFPCPPVPWREPFANFPRCAYQLISRNRRGAPRHEYQYSQAVGR